MKHWHLLGLLNLRQSVARRTPLHTRRRLQVLPWPKRPAVLSCTERLESVHLRFTYIWPFIPRFCLSVSLVPINYYFTSQYTVTETVTSCLTRHTPTSGDERRIKQPQTTSFSVSATLDPPWGTSSSRSLFWNRTLSPPLQRKVMLSATSSLLTNRAKFDWAFGMNQESTWFLVT